MEYHKDERIEGSLVSVDASSGQGILAGQASKRIFITDVIISTDTALTVSIRDGDNNGLIPNLYMPANSIFAKSFGVGRSTEVNKNVKVVTSGAGNVSVTLTGYKK